MTVLIRRAIACVSALVATCAGVGISSPAVAADPQPADLGVIVSSTKISAGSKGKHIVAKVTNVGETPTVGLTVTFDSDFGGDRFGLIPLPGCIDAGDGVRRCEFPDLVLLPGATFEAGVSVEPLSNAVPGDTASFLAKVSSAGAPDDPPGPIGQGNNEFPVTVTMVGNGADLVVIASDVFERDANGKQVGPVKPGDTAKLLFTTANFGDRTASVWKRIIRLPEHVSFVETDEQRCSYDQDRREETCQFSGEEDLFEPGIIVNDSRLIKVSADAPGPVRVEGGEVEALVVDEIQPPDTAIEATAGAPAAGKTHASTQDEIMDYVDGGDNKDEFAVFVRQPPGAPGGGGGLPVTGTSVGTLAGAGAAAMLAGVLVMLLARRRVRTRRQAR